MRGVERLEGARAVQADHAARLLRASCLPSCGGVDEGRRMGEFPPRQGRRIEYLFYVDGAWQWCGGRVVTCLARGRAAGGIWASVAFDDETRKGTVETWKRTVYLSRDARGEVWREEDQASPAAPAAAAPAAAAPAASATRRGTPRDAAAVRPSPRNLRQARGSGVERYVPPAADAPQRLSMLPRQQQSGSIEQNLESVVFATAEPSEDDATAVMATAECVACAQRAAGRHATIAHVCGNEKRRRWPSVPHAREKRRKRAAGSDAATAPHERTAEAAAAHPTTAAAAAEATVTPANGQHSVSRFVNERIEYRFGADGGKSWQWYGGRVLSVHRDDMWAKVAFDNEGVAESWTRLVRATADGFGDAWRPESEGWKSKPVAKTTHVVWTEETDRRLIELVEKQGLGNWRRKNTLLRFASEAPTPELVERRWQKLFRKAMLVQNPRGDKTTVKHGDDSFPAVVRHTDSVAWIHYIGWSENTDEFIRRSELLERVPEEWTAIEHICCKVCGSADNADTMLLCDGCDTGYHLSCVHLDEMPKTKTWYCAQRACQSKGAAKAKQKTKQPNSKHGRDINTKHSIKVLQVVEYKFIDSFIDSDDQVRWYPGVVSNARPGWPGWYDVEFEDSTKKYSLEFTDDNYGTAWRNSKRWASEWTAQMDTKLHELVKKYGSDSADWQAKADELGNVHRLQVLNRWHQVLLPALIDRCDVCNDSKGTLLTCAGCKRIVHEHCCMLGQWSSEGQAAEERVWFCDKVLCQRKAAPRKRRRPETTLPFQEPVVPTDKRFAVPRPLDQAGEVPGEDASAETELVKVWDAIHYAFTKTDRRVHRQTDSDDRQWFRGVVIETTQWDGWYNVLFEEDNSQCCVKICRDNNKSAWRLAKPKPWSKALAQKLVNLVKQEGVGNWDMICRQLRTGTPDFCRQQWYKEHWQLVLESTARLRTAGINRLFDARLSTKAAPSVKVDGDSPITPINPTSDPPLPGKAKGAPWSSAELNKMLEVVKKHSVIDVGSNSVPGPVSVSWAAIAAELGTGRTAGAVYQKWWINREALLADGPTASASSTAVAETARLDDSADAVKVGDRVKAVWQDGRSYPATVVAVRHGDVTVRWKDKSDVDATVTAEFVKLDTDSPASSSNDNDGSQARLDAAAAAGASNEATKPPPQGSERVSKDDLQDILSSGKLLNRRVSVWWVGDQCWYSGVVTASPAADAVNKFVMVYDDSEMVMESTDAIVAVHSNSRSTEEEEEGAALESAATTNDEDLRSHEQSLGKRTACTWEDAELDLLSQIVGQHDRRAGIDWAAVADALGTGRTATAVRQKCSVERFLHPKRGTGGATNQDRVGDAARAALATIATSAQPYDDALRNGVYFPLSDKRHPPGCNCANCSRKLRVLRNERVHIPSGATVPAMGAPAATTAAAAAAAADVSDAAVDTSTVDSQSDILDVTDLSFASSFFTSEKEEAVMRKRTNQIKHTECTELKDWSPAKIPVVVKRAEQKGYGAFAKKRIQAGEFIGEFAGEVINTAEMNRRKRLYDSFGVSEQFHYIFDLKCGLQIDASAAGNLTRFMNHHDQQSGNANVRAALINDYGFRRVVFRADRNIACGEEMCYDYGNSFKDFCGIELVT